VAVFGGAWRIRERIVEAGGRSVAQDFRAYRNLFLRLYQMSNCSQRPFHFRGTSTEPLASSWMYTKSFLPCLDEVSQHSLPNLWFTLWLYDSTT
jgi:hypothetical protein